MACKTNACTTEQNTEDGVCGPVAECGAMKRRDLHEIAPPAPEEPESLPVLYMPPAEDMIWGASEISAEIEDGDADIEAEEGEVIVNIGDGGTSLLVPVSAILNEMGIGKAEMNSIMLFILRNGIPIQDIWKFLVTDPVRFYEAAMLYSHKEPDADILKVLGRQEEWGDASEVERLRRKYPALTSLPVLRLPQALKQGSLPKDEYDTATLLIGDGTDYESKMDALLTFQGLLLDDELPIEERNKAIRELFAAVNDDNYDDNESLAAEALLILTALYTAGKLMPREERKAKSIAFEWVDERAYGLLRDAAYRSLLALYKAGRLSDDEKKTLKKKLRYGVGDDNPNVVATIIETYTAFFINGEFDEDFARDESKRTYEVLANVYGGLQSDYRPEEVSATAAQALARLYGSGALTHEETKEARDALFAKLKGERDFTYAAVASSLASLSVKGKLTREDEATLKRVIFQDVDAVERKNGAGAWFSYIVPASILPYLYLHGRLTTREEERTRKFLLRMTCSKEVKANRRGYSASALFCLYIAGELTGEEKRAVRDSLFELEQTGRSNLSTYARSTALSALFSLYTLGEPTSDEKERLDSLASEGITGTSSVELTARAARLIYEELSPEEIARIIRRTRKRILSGASYTFALNVFAPLILSGRLDMTERHRILSLRIFSLLDKMAAGEAAMDTYDTSPLDPLRAQTFLAGLQRWNERGE